jgi:hypothetical protein
MCDLPSWIQAISAVVLVLATVATFIVLLGYAADTKKIAENSVKQVSASLAQATASAEQAKASAEQAKASNEQAKNSAQQLEDAQTPFVGLVLAVNQVGQSAWAIRNQGAGVAINVMHSRWVGPGKDPIMTWSPSLGVGELHFVGREDGQFCETLNGFTVEFESLAGKRYRSNFIRQNMELKTRFEKL